VPFESPEDGAAHFRQRARQPARSAGLAESGALGVLIVVEFFLVAGLPTTAANFLVLFRLEIADEHIEFNLSLLALLARIVVFGFWRHDLPFEQRS
jgi:hypothetical protein